jgi:hypothetical protein
MAISVIKKSAIQRMLDLERPHLPTCQAMIDMLQTKLSTI